MRLISNFLVGCIWAVSLALVFAGNSATAAGFREMVAGNVAFGVWYPSDAPTIAQRLGPFEVEFARDAPARAGKHPIILFSHGISGHYRNHHLTIQALADAGFVVIAPQHEADYLVGGRKTAAALNHRYHDLATALDAVLHAPEFSEVVDPKQVHGLGFSLGGATTLLAAGAGFASKRAAQHCRANKDADPEFCEDPGMIYRFVQSFRHNVELPNTRDPFRNPPLLTGQAVVVAPVFQGIDPAPPIAVTKLTVMAIKGDEIAVPTFHAQPLFEAVSEGAGVAGEYREISGHHFAFIAPFPKWLTDKEDIPVAKDPEGFDRSAFLTDINALIVAIFTQE